MMSTTESFWRIIEEEMERRDVSSFRALEDAGRVANGTVSQRARELLPPTPTTIDAIATAFDVPTEIVKVWTKGLRPPETEAEEKELLYLFRQLPAGERRRILAIARAFSEDENG